MRKFEKIIINDKEQLDEIMRFKIGGSWDYVSDRYPAVYPVLLVISKDRQTWDYIYKSDFHWAGQAGKKPPLGLRPRMIAEWARVDEIYDAIERYTYEKRLIPEEWITEYNELISRLK